MEREGDLGSCSSSSIGRNSDVSGGSSDGEDSGETEVQSSYKGPLDTMDALEEVFPIRKGISKFYSGKSKSFMSLSETSSVSFIKDLAKPDNPYNRKRKNLLAHSFWDKNHNYPLRNNRSGISKKPVKSSRSTLNLGATLSSSKSNNNSEDSNLMSLSSSCRLPPQHPQVKISPSNRSSSPHPRRNPPWRSFSLSDLQCVASATPNITSLALVEIRTTNCIEHSAEVSLSHYESGSRRKDNGVREFSIGSFLL